jgi:hypothetical protein
VVFFSILVIQFSGSRFSHADRVFLKTPPDPKPIFLTRNLLHETLHVFRDLMEVSSAALNFAITVLAIGPRTVVGDELPRPTGSIMFETALASAFGIAELAASSR